MLSVVIIDDEKNSRELLKKLLSKYCEQVEVLGMANSVSTGIHLLNNHNPDLLFLDIEMPGGTGFDLLENIKDASFETCFVTGYEKYAIKAIKHGAIDYLLKPVEISELKAAVAKCKKLKKEQSNARKKSIIVSDAEQYTVISIEKIVQIDVINNYTVIVLNKNKKVLSKERLNYFENILPPECFIRTHKSHIVNLNYVESLISGRSLSVNLKNGDKLPVAARRKKEFLLSFEQFNSEN